MTLIKNVASKMFQIFVLKKMKQEGSWGGEGEGDEWKLSRLVYRPTKGWLGTLKVMGL